MDTQMDSARYRVTGALLRGLIGENVVLVGVIRSVRNNGMQATLTTSDKMEVEIELVERLSPNSENKLIEIEGRVARNDRIENAHFVDMPADYLDQFDMELYNKAVVLTAQYGQFYIQANKSN